MTRETNPIKEFNYSCRVADSSYIEIKVLAPRSEEADIKNVISQVVGKALQDDNFIQEKAKRIEISLGDRIYRTSASPHLLPIENDEPIKQEEVAPYKIKITQIAERHFPQRSRKFQEIRKSLLDSWPHKVPIISLFWELAILPVAALIKCIHPGKTYDTSSLSLKEDPHAEGALEDAIREVLEVLEGEDQLSADFNLGLEFTSQWRRKKANKTVISETIAQTIVGLEAGALLPLASGCWKDGVFQPILWSFQKNEEGRLTLVEMSYGNLSGELSATYLFPEDFNEKTLQELIYMLLTLSEKPHLEHGLNRKAISAALYVGTAAALIKHTEDSSAAESDDNERAAEFYDTEAFKRAIILGAGASLMETKTAQATESEDPLKLLTQAITHFYPEAIPQDKAFFSLHVFHSRLSKITSALPVLKKEQRQYWLNRLNQDYKSVIHQIEKSGLDSSPEDLWDLINQQMETFRAAVDVLQAEELYNQSKRQKKLDRVKTSDHLDLNINIKKIASIDFSPVRQVSRLDAVDYEKVSRLRELINEVKNGEVNSIEEMNAALQDLTGRINELLDARQYESSTLLCRYVMELIPDPPVSSARELSDTDDFWLTLENVEGFEVEQIRERSNQIKTFSEEWGNISHYFWESKSLSHQLKPKPDELVYLFSLHVTLHRLAVSRANVLDQIIQLEGDESLDFEEECVNKLAERRIDFPGDGLNTFVRPGEHPKLAKKMKSLHHYSYSHFSYKTNPNLVRNKADYLLLVQQIQEIAASKNLEPGKKLLFSILDREKPQGASFIPSFLTDQERHRRFAGTLFLDGAAMTFAQGIFFQTGMTYRLPRERMDISIKNEKKFTFFAQLSRGPRVKVTLPKDLHLLRLGPPHICRQKRAI